MARFRLARLFQFSLRTLLLVVTAASSYLGWEWRFVHEQLSVNQMLKHCGREREKRRSGSGYEYTIVRWRAPSEYSGLRRLLGARAYPIRCFDGYFTQAELDRIRRAYPDVTFDLDDPSDSTT